MTRPLSKNAQSGRPRPDQKPPPAILDAPSAAQPSQGPPGTPQAIMGIAMVRAFPLIVSVRLPLTSHGYSSLPLQQSPWVASVTHLPPTAHEPTECFVTAVRSLEEFFGSKEGVSTPSTGWDLENSMATSESDQGCPRFERFGFE